MSDPIETTFLEVLNEHGPTPETVARCRCGWEIRDTGDDHSFVPASEQHRAHVADRLAACLERVDYRAWVDTPFNESDEASVFRLRGEQE